MGAGGFQFGARGFTVRCGVIDLLLKRFGFAGKGFNGNLGVFAQAIFTADVGVNLCLLGV